MFHGIAAHYFTVCIDRELVARMLIRAARGRSTQATRTQRSATRTRRWASAVPSTRGDCRLAYEQMKRAKSMRDDWFVQYAQMLSAFEESARTGKPSAIAFESPVSAGVR